MRPSTRSAILCAAVVALNACGGTSAGTSVPALSSGTGAQTVSRSNESRTSGVIYVEFGDRIDVYPKTAQGTPAPVRSITGLPAFGPLALDRFGNLYVGDTVSWTVREYRTSATGTVQLLRTFSAPDRQHPTDQHFTLGLAVRYDGGIAMLGGRSPRTASPAVSVLGVFSARDGGFDILQERPESVGGLTVDGVGNVLFAYVTPAHIDFPAPANIVRFSPHPYGFHDDGVIGIVDGNYQRFAFAMAASPSDALQFNDLRCNASDERTVTCNEQTSVQPHFQALKFDAEQNLYSLSVAPNLAQAIVEVFRAAPNERQAPIHSFTPHRTGSAQDFYGPTDLAVSD